MKLLIESRSDVVFDMDPRSGSLTSVFPLLLRGPREW